MTHHLNLMSTIKTNKKNFDSFVNNLYNSGYEIVITNQINTIEYDVYVGEKVCIYYSAYIVPKEKSKSGKTEYYIQIRPIPVTVEIDYG